MNADLVDKLYNSYQRTYSVPVPYDICTDDGWYQLLDVLSSCIEQYLKQHPELDFKVVQVKEKFGGLRFYYDGGDSYIWGLVQMAESMSYQICEQCGNPGTCSGTGWAKTRCSQCQK